MRNLLEQPHSDDYETMNEFHDSLRALGKVATFDPETSLQTDKIEVFGSQLPANKPPE